MTLLDQFLAWLHSWVDVAIYVWGGNGEEMTPSRIERMETSDENYKRALALYSERAADGIEPVIGFDCSGLVSKFLQNLGFVKSKRNCNHLAKMCVKVTAYSGDPTTLKLGDLVFRYNGSKPYFHVGVYIGMGCVIESRGRDAGVCISKAYEKASDKDRKKYGHDYYWHRTGTLKVLAAIVEDSNVLSMGDKGAEVVRLQELLIAKGYSLPKHGADGDFGAETEAAVKVMQEDTELPVTGIVDDATWDALMEEDTPEAQEYMAICTGGSVYVRTGPGTDHKALGTAHQGDALRVTDEVDGWCAIDVSLEGKGQVSGYMSAKYVRAA